MKAKMYGAGSDIRRVLYGMVTNQTVLSRIAGQWSGRGLFNDNEADLIGKWCVDHMRTYGEPPNGQIKVIFDEWANLPTTNNEVAVLVDRTLRAVNEMSNDELGSSNYLLDLAEKHFNRVKLKEEWEQSELDLDQGNVNEACNRMSRFSRINLGQGPLIKPGEDFELWTEAFDEEQQKSLVGYPGRLNDFLGDVMVRDSLIAFMAPDKTGKSFWLLDAAFRAVRGKSRVAMFEVGDMSRNQVVLRIASRVTKRPRKAGPYELPVSVTREGEVERKRLECDKPLGPRESFRAFKRFCGNMDLFRLSCHANSSIDVFGIESILRDWSRDGWVPDVVVIDYADILAPPSGIREVLDQVDSTWRHLRRLSQEFSCLVLTATQSNAAAYTNKRLTLGKQHFSGRKTKLAHVNGMVGLNVTDKFRREGITGVNWVVRREGRYSESRMLLVAGCLAISNPAMKCIE
jgi:hypothetical protein